MCFVSFYFFAFEVSIRFALKGRVRRSKPMILRPVGVETLHGIGVGSKALRRAARRVRPPAYFVSPR